MTSQFCCLAAPAAPLPQIRMSLVKTSNLARSTRRREESTERSHSVQFINNCGFGAPSLQSTDGQLLSGASVNFSGKFVRGIGFLDQGTCGSATTSNCTSLEINLEGNSSHVRILKTHFSVPVSFVFSQGCSSSGQCLNQACSRHLLECRSRDASVSVTFCPKSPVLFPPPSTTPAISPTTSPKSGARSLSSQSTSYPSSRLSSRLVPRASNTRRLLGAELGGTIGGAVFLALVFIAVVCIRRRHARALEARMPQRQVPFVVNPTWVLASPTTLEGGQSQSHLSLPDRARPRTVPVVAHQMSMPNLATQYRTRVLRPRASTVGSATLTRTETRESARAQSEAVAVGPTRSESSVWRPRIDILSARQTRTEGPGHPQSPMDSFWAE
ncbi:hypothetical protein C8R44DRAFT_991388 [Mycena epipterygia]|nr:hypothetical protein C8R44DRAFT_991388 [Mycena epipterygia]